MSSRGNPVATLHDHQSILVPMPRLESYSHFLHQTETAGGMHVSNVSRKGFLIAIGGLSGTGKSTLSRALTQAFNERALNVNWIRTDAIRKELAGVRPEEKLP